jgi:hypothetical protein
MPRGIFAPMWGEGVKRGRDEAPTLARVAPVKRARTGAAPVRAVAMEDVASSSLPGVRAATYCVKQRKKTANTNAHIATISVKGKTRYQLKATCAECGCKKCSFLTAAKTGGRLR